LAGVYGGSAYLAASNLEKSAKAGDVAALDELVDFPSVREGLKSQMNAAMMAKMQSDPELANNPFAGLGMMLAPAIIERAVDAYVTPDGIAAIVRGQRLNEPPQAAAENRDNPDVEYGSQWVDLDTFKVTARKDGSNETMPSFIFKREGFATWKLKKIQLPDEFMRSK
jgi:hypothetical protein